MVLTNFGIWTSNGSAMSLDYSSVHARHVDPFGSRAVEQPSQPSGQANPNLSHISSNGYYGFSYVNTAYQPAPTNNNDTFGENNNSNYIARNVNNMDSVGASAVRDTGTTTPLNHTRCKKRFFVVSDDDLNMLDDVDAAVTGAAAKRCRFDDDFAAQYCNDFFSLPSTQIATQSCLMETEDYGSSQPTQPQVNAAMHYKSNHNNNSNHMVDRNVNSQHMNTNENVCHVPQRIELQTLSVEQQQQHEQEEQQHEHLSHHNHDHDHHPHRHHQQHQHYQERGDRKNKANKSATFEINSNSDNNSNNSDFYKSLDSIKSAKQGSSSSSSSSSGNGEQRGQVSEMISIGGSDSDHDGDTVVDDAILYSQTHGGCVHHYYATTAVAAAAATARSALRFLAKDENYFEEI